ncbi:caspase family protein [Cognaticolwellia aestuarii]|uniref:caspase family protein n=1 Tax=Cognaticolwellia aestuarii TaxID=329993 RepID=UPI000986D826|nr:caspase family protein [Cognaticolwellia aestuarii]
MSNKLFLIGINAYSHQANLESSIRDITDFKNILLEKFEFEEKDVYEITDENATSKNIQDAFRSYIKQLNENDNLVIYYSGHGDFDESSDIGYWIPHEADHYTDYIPNNTITAYLEKIACKHIFLISDSCFSNSLLRSGKTKSIEEYFEKKSRWALASAFNEAKDSDAYSNTLFAEVLIDALENSTKNLRVSEIIENVKKRFEINQFQTPQGSPLQISGHNGGEFIFNVRQQLDKREFKGYVDFKKILKLYKRNSNFTELDTFEDKTNKIGYQLFEEIDSVIQKSTNYLYLYEGINQTKTLKKLQDQHPKLISSKNLVIFIPIEKDQKITERRKKNINDKFKPISLFYIDDFIREHCTPKVILDDDSKYLNISNFILPILNNDSENSEVKNYFHNWYNQVDDPILVIKGSGGIGKTTLAHYFADKLMHKNPSRYVLFIDSILIKDSLLKNKNRGNLNLYNFYEALFDITDNIQEKLSEELFQLNIDAGNILIIIDGLDEVISKIPNFNVSEFLKSIKSSTTDLCNGKVIITCRTYFWDNTNFVENNFSIIELEPFSEEQTEEFFNKSFGEAQTKIKKAIKLANDFKFPSNDGKHIYHPYVLDIIRSIIDSEDDTINFDLSDLHSKYLNSEIKNDYITYRVCDREIKRVGQISVEEQIQFFIYLSVQKRGTVKALHLQHEIEKSLGKSINKTSVEAFKSHPFLKCLDSSVVFKYDFLSDLFKSIYLSSYFNFDNDQNAVSDHFTDIISESCWFGSALNTDTTNRIKHWDTDDVLLVSDVISQIKLNYKNAESNKIVGNIFNLCLAINHKFNPNDVVANTNLLKDLFEVKAGEIEGLCLIDINVDQKIKFDFSDLQLSNSVIDNYDNFWWCKFNDKTKFINSELLNLNGKHKNTGLNKANFIDCNFDSSLEKSLKAISSNNHNQLEKIKIFLHDFFHLFVSNGRLGRQWEHKVILPRFSAINKCNINYKRLIQILKNHEFILIDNELNKRKFSIKSDNKENVVKYIKDGTVSNSIAKIIKELQ